MKACDGRDEPSGSSDCSTLQVLAKSKKIRVREHVYHDQQAT